MSELAVKRMTLAEFLCWEDGTDTRYELVDGVPVAMAPPAVLHGRLSFRLVSRVGAALEARPPCFGQTEAGIARPDHDDTFYIADLAVSCTPSEPRDQMLRDPVLIIEILSPTTLAVDRQEKIPAYRQIASVQEIVALNSERVFAEVMRREGDRWITELVQGRNAILSLTTIGLTVAMSDLYDGIELPETPRRQQGRRAT